MSRVDTKAKLLIVEDEQIAARNLKEMCEELGYEIVGVAMSADEALYQTKLYEPDLVLLDIVLKGPRDGVSLANLLRDEQAIAIIYTTSYADAMTVARVTETRPNGYLVKPFRRDELFVSIETALSQLRNASEPERLRALADASAADGGLTQGMLLAIEEHVERRLDQNITINELAQLVALSPGHFGALFKRATNRTPYAYVISKRIEEARRLLVHTTMPIAEIAFSVGYEGQSHFTTVFRKEVGLTPAAYRRL